MAIIKWRRKRCLAEYILFLSSMFMTQCGIRRLRVGRLTRPDFQNWIIHGRLLFTGNWRLVSSSEFYVLQYIAQDILLSEHDRRTVEKKGNCRIVSVISSLFFSSFLFLLPWMEIARYLNQFYLQLILQRSSVVFLDGWINNEKESTHNTCLGLLWG